MAALHCGTPCCDSETSCWFSQLTLVVSMILLAPNLA